MPSTTTSTKPQTLNPASIVTPVPSYHQVCTTPLLPSSRLITLAGQTGTPPSGPQDIAPDFLAQVRQAYQNVLLALKSAGATPRDIVHVRHYIVQHAPREQGKEGKRDGEGGGEGEARDEREVYERGWPEVWIEFMDREGEGHRPPDTVLGVAGLATRKLLYEVEVWAVVS